MASPQRRSRHMSAGGSPSLLFHHRYSGSFSSASYSPADYLPPPNNIYTAPIPSYLKVKPSSEEASYKHKTAVEEADVAGGRGGGGRASTTQSVFRRVSSFGIMSRLPSQSQLSSASLKEGSNLSSHHKQNLTFASSSSSAGKHPLQADHVTNEGNQDYSNDPNHASNANDYNSTLKPSWRLKDRMKTVGVGLVMALYVGTDPPDIVKPEPCAKLQCWMDPASLSRAKAKEKIGDLLEAQYMRWQQQRAARNVKYRKALDPTVEDVRNLCQALRRAARNERILLHYNGHGVPRPTPNGEIWVFDRHHTEYIPLPVSDLKQWMGSPAIVVLDCSSAGTLIRDLTKSVTGTPPNTPPRQPMGQEQEPQQQQEQPFDMDAAASEWVRDTIVLCPTSEDEWLPMQPEYPRDIFTSCLTTPIKIALRWFVRQNKTSMGSFVRQNNTLGSLNPEDIDAIPGNHLDRKTPLGELNWVFITITDSLAWNVLPKPLFQRLFRQDLLVASMFRNFLLADRILRSMKCTPQSYPPLPPGVADHPLWQAWDLACETCLFGLIQDGILGNDDVIPTATEDTTDGASVGTNMTEATTAGPSVATSSITSQERGAQPPTASQPNIPQTGPASSLSLPFFTEQLRAFEVWLEYASIHKDRIEELESPEQLPVVLQVLLSQAHRIRALELLRRFLALGPWAVNLSLSLGIFPYVMKLLPSKEYKSLLVDIWASILKFDPSCKQDLVKDGALKHFIPPLKSWSEQSPIESAKQRTFAAFSLAVVCHEYPQAQTECLIQNIHVDCKTLLEGYSELKKKADEEGHESLRPQLMSPKNREWLCVCLGNMAQAFPPAQNEICKSKVHSSLLSRLDDDSANVRAAASFALGCLLEYVPNMRSTAPSPMALSPQGLAPATFQPSPQTLQTFSRQQGLVPQQINESAMAAQAGLTSSTVLTGQLQPPLVNPSFAGNQPQIGALWHPSQAQQAPRMQQQQQQRSQPQAAQPTIPGGMQPSMIVQRHVSAPVPTSQQPPSINRLTATTQGLNLGGPPLQAGAPLLTQQNILRPQGGAGLGGSMMGGPSIVPPGIVGSPIMGTSLGASMAPAPSFLSPIPPMEQQQNRRRQTVYEDRQRTNLDLTVAEGLCKALHDGSSLVRYEAMIALGNFVEKYIDGFLVVAEETSPKAPESADVNVDQGKPSAVVPIPKGLNRPTLDRFTVCWKTIKAAQYGETHPNVRQLADEVTGIVHDKLDDRMVERDSATSKEDQKGLSGIDEEGFGSELERRKSDPRQKTPNQSRKSSGEQTKGDTTFHRSPEKNEYPYGQKTSGSSSSGSDSRASLNQSGDTRSGRVRERVESDYRFPKSKHYEWMVETFDSNADDTEDQDFEDLDPLNPVGAVRAYQGRRNAIIQESARKLGDHFERLKPKPKEKGLDLMLEISDEEADEAESSLRGELKLVETKVLRNTGEKMTSMVKFHSYEDVLMICDTDSMSFWDYETGVRSISYKNGNPEKSRITTAFWMNEPARSLCFVGCDDGSARIWGGALENNGQVSSKAPTLSSSFTAASDMQAGQRGSGQQHSSTVIAGGNSSYIRCWDLVKEKCSANLSTGTEACVTTLCTAWDDDRDVPSGGVTGMGPDIVVAGHSDGSLKVFDIRSPNGVLKTSGRRQRKSVYTEHKDWIVDVSFACYGGKPEILTGSLDGEIRAWDLRMSSSLRVLEVQRSLMTAMAVHKHIPIAATGSRAQFIKILTLEGETLQVARHHEGSPRHLIGPVSCLEFHKYKLALAAGTTDSLISVYKPRPPKK
eukprot:scaffold3001_cov122-Cylindrotheca_fusiformis.AAC.7